MKKGMNKDIGANGGKNHLGMIFEEAGQFPMPDLLKNYALAAPKLQHLTGKASDVNDFTWQMVSGTGGVDPYDDRKYPRRKLK